MSTPDLNAAQQMAVDHENGPAIVLAGPGAGKTKTLTQRAAALVRKNIAPERILLLTFSRASAREMLTRAKNIDPRCEFISGGTFHATATRVINKNAHIFGMDRPFSILDPEDVTEIVKKIMDQRKNDDRNWPRASTIAKIISFATNTRLSIEKAIEARAIDYLEFLDDIVAVREAYVTYKLTKGLLDYDDCLEYMAILLEDRDIGPQLRAQWSHIMVDEFQDTNALQLQIIWGLAGDTANIMIVGDPAQSIYSFRGAAPQTMEEFYRRFPQSKVIALETNYRSTPEIVSLVNVVDGSMDIGFKRTLHAQKQSISQLPRLIEVTDQSEEATAIADAILDHKVNGGEISDNTILVRSMSYARRIESEFITRKIPYRVVGGIRIDEAAHIKDLLCLVRVSTNHEHEPAWLRLVGRYAKIGDKAASQIADRLISCVAPERIYEVLEQEALNRKTQFPGLMKALRALTATGQTAELVSNAAIQMDAFWRIVWPDNWDDRKRDIEAILLIAAEHPTLDSFLTAITLDHSLEKKNSPSQSKNEERPLTISTVHGAKGLEWPVVHIPSFIRGHMPSTYAEDPQEELRILYVALSRAESYLRLYRPRFDAKGGFTSQSDFEYLLRPSLQVEARPRASAPLSGSIETTKRIDMREKLLGRHRAPA